MELRVLPEPVCHQFPERESVCNRHRIQRQLRRTVFIDAVEVAALLALGAEPAAPAGRLTALGLTGDPLTLLRSALSIKDLELVKCS